MAEHYPVRIASGPTEDRGIWHCQAQAFINGEWEFLSYPIFGGIEPGKRDKNYKIVEYLSLGDFIDQYISLGESEIATKDQKQNSE